MKQIILDTNILVRHVTHDNPEHTLRVTRLFEDAQNGRSSLVLLPLVLGEVCFVLEKVYMHTHASIAQQLSIITQQSWITVEHRSTVNAVWPLYAQGMHFVDAFLHAHAQQMGYSLATFDKKLARKK